jgi:hypothetical protein
VKRGDQRQHRVGRIDTVIADGVLVVPIQVLVAINQPRQQGAIRKIPRPFVRPHLELARWANLGNHVVAHANRAVRDWRLVVASQHLSRAQQPVSHGCFSFLIR